MWVSSSQLRETPYPLTIMVSSWIHSAKGCVVIAYHITKYALLLVLLSAY